MLAAAGCRQTAVAHAPTSITVVTGGPGGALYPLALRLQQVYTAEFPGIAIELQPLGSSGSLDALQDGRAQLGFAQADIAYVAYSRGTAEAPAPHANLRGVAVLWTNAVQIAVPRDSPIRTPYDLRGRRVAVGTPGTSTEVMARIILKAFGLSYAEIRPSFTSFDDRVKAMRTGAIDAAFVVTAIPAPAVEEMNASRGIRLVPIGRDRANALVGQYPFVRPIVVPRGTYGANADVPAIGVDELLICRNDLDTDLVYRLTRTFFESLGSLARVNAAAGSIDVDDAPGTPIPLHPGAARYYREREIDQ